MSKNTYFIREAQPSDAQEMLAYLKIVGGESHNLSFGKEGIPVSVEEETAHLLAYTKHPINRHWVVIDQNEIVAVCSFDVPSRPRMAHRASFGISVRKDHWRQGIATALMKTMMAHAKTIPSVTMIAMEVITDNERAIALYERFGFQISGTLHQLFLIDGAYYDAYVMECDLSIQRKDETL